MTAYMLSRTKKRTLILCHRMELLEMISGGLSVPHGLILPGQKTTPPDQVLVGMIQTVQRRLDRLPKFEWVISDEAHLAMADGWRNTLKYYDKAWHLGMSATPCRLDGRGLGDVFDTFVFGPSVRELTERGYLVPCKTFAPPAPSTDGLKKTAGEYSMDDAGDMFGTPKVVGDAIEHLERHGAWRPTIVFCCTRAHAEGVAASFRARGFTAANIDGSMTKEQRGRLVAMFKARQIQVLTNVELLTTGFDAPLIECAIFLRPTVSLALWLQMVGRVLRISLGKTEAIVLDHVGNSLRLGLPDDDREWSLDGTPKKRKEALALKQCTSCFMVHRPAPKCPHCGYVYPVMQRLPQQVAGDLVEVRAKEGIIKAAKLSDLLRDNMTYAELLEIARVKGYRISWAWHVLRAQQEKRKKDRGES